MYIFGVLYFQNIGALLEDFVAVIKYWVSLRGFIRYVLSILKVYGKEGPQNVSVRIGHRMVSDRWGGSLEMGVEQGGFSFSG